MIWSDLTRVPLTSRDVASQVDESRPKPRRGSDVRDSCGGTRPLATNRDASRDFTSEACP
jgi:hypothetical protein